MTENSNTPDSGRLHAYLQAYFDGQLDDPSLVREIEAGLAADPGLGSEYRALQATRERLRALPADKAPAYLRARVRSALDDARPQRSVWRRYGWLPAAAAIAAVIAVGSLRDQPTTDAPQELAAFVDDHIDLIQTPTNGLQSSDPRELQEWFKEQLDYAPVVPQWSWLTPVSGQICYAGGRRTARVYYRTNENEVSLFINLPMQPGKMQAMGATGPDKAVIDTIRGYKVACWGDKGLDYVLVAQASADTVFDRLKQENV